MERTGLIDLRRAKARNYDRFYLKRNPFPAIGIPEETLLITADREAVIKRFQNVITELLDSDQSIITVMVGEYGSGKSHLLKLFKKSVDAQLLSSEKTMAVYIKSPGEDFSYFFYGFVDNVGLELLKQISVAYISEKLASDKKLQKHLTDSKVMEGFLAGKVRFEEMITKSFFPDLINDIEETYFSDIERDLAQAFLSFANPKMSSIAWRWILGESLDKDEKELLDVSASIDSSGTYELFCDLVKLLHKAGIKNMVILVDELEKITLLSKTRKGQYQDDLRRLIDDHPTNVCFYFAIAPAQWQDLTREPTALVRRLKGNWHLLEDFKENDTKELVEKYLFSARIDLYPVNDIRGKYRSLETSMFPFTKEAIEIINKEAKGVVSDVLLICRRSLELLADFSQYEIIDSKVVQLAMGKE